RRRIDRGALILSEEPLFTIREPHAEITNEALMRALQKLPASRKRSFLLLRDNASGAFRSLGHAFAENSFNMASEDDTGRQLDCLHGLFLLHSRFNHSCSPSSNVPATGGEITHLQSFATRDIVPGEEITFSYAADFGCRTREERHRELRFVCNCETCQSGNPFQELSDMRRRLVRGLQYLQVRADLDGRRQDATGRPLITDPQLKPAADTLRIPLWSRFIYGLLTMSLLEQEGLLDDFMAERLSRNVLVPFAMFKTESNVQVAKLAMAQQDWLGRLCVAFQLYGRADAADEAMATLFRALSGR
ncbi:hypothetical protein B0T14DRAFT_441647, partial [Immersiella caudata]